MPFSGGKGDADACRGWFDRAACGINDDGGACSNCLDRTAG